VVHDFTGNIRTDFVVGASGSDPSSNGAGGMYLYTGRENITIPQLWARYDQASGQFK